jgi:hypothetical protein
MVKNAIVYPRRSILRRGHLSSGNLPGVGVRVLNEKLLHRKWWGLDLLIKPEALETICR